MRNTFSIFLIIFTLSSCERTNDPPVIDPIESLFASDGVFVINEGNFMSGNGSVSFYKYDSLKIHNDIFRKVNIRPLGDVPNSMKILNDKAYIVVNNSGKIEVVKMTTFESLSTITGINSPRDIAFVNNSKAYVTSMYSDSVTILNLTDNSIAGFINIHKSSESVLIYGNRAYVSSWIGGNKVIVIDNQSDVVIDSITVGIEPESMEIDRNNTIWVLCNGGWKRENFAELIRINSQSGEIIKRLVFPSITDSPSCLRINGSGDTLYYLQQGVRRLSIDDTDLPGEALIAETENYFYKLGINPESGEILVTDAVDFQQNGYLLRFKADGTPVSSDRTGIIPGFLCVKIRSSQVIE
jgi:hypothetical protein